jgi:hypothetical protein
MARAVAPKPCLLRPEELLPAYGFAGASGVGFAGASGIGVAGAAGVVIAGAAGAGALVAAGDGSSTSVLLRGHIVAIAITTITAAATTYQRRLS